MENTIETLLTNKIFIVIMVLLCALLVYSLLKRLLKLIIFLLIALFIYVGYMSYTGQKLPKSSEEIMEQVIKTKDSLQKKSTVVIDSIKKMKKANEIMEGSSEEKAKTEETASESTQSESESENK